MTELCIIQGKENEGDDPTKVEHVAHLEATEFVVQKKQFKEMDRGTEQRLRPSIENPPILELKTLPEHLEYAFLQKDSKLPVIISSKLQVDQKEKLLRVP